MISLKSRCWRKWEGRAELRWEGAALTPSDHAPRTFRRYTLWGSEGESFEFSLFTLGPFCPPHAQEGHFLLPDNGNNGRAVSRRGGWGHQAEQSLKQAVLVGDTGSAWYCGQNKARSVRCPDDRGTDSPQRSSAAGR